MPESEIIEWLACALGAILLLGSVWTVFEKFLKPYKDIKKRVKTLEDYRQSHEEVSQDINDATKILCKGMLSLLDHAITNNNVDKLKTMRTELQEFLINKN